MINRTIKSIEVCIDLPISASMSGITVESDVTLCITKVGFEYPIEETIGDVFESYDTVINKRDLSEEENRFVTLWLSDHVDEIREHIEKHINRTGSLENLDCMDFEFELDEKQSDGSSDGKENVPTEKPYTQVCVWPGLLLKEDEIKNFDQLIFEHFNGARVKYLETIITGPNVKSDGSIEPETGGRHDVFFVIHEEDIAKFAIARLQAGIRWIEDVLSPINYKQAIYPNRVHGYKTW